MCSIVIYNHCLVLLMLSFMYFTTERWVRTARIAQRYAFYLVRPPLFSQNCVPAGARARGAAGAGAAGAGFH